MTTKFLELKTLVLALLFSMVSVWSALSAPTITSFAPASGAVGTTVTITGANFNTTAANNIVYFGASKATVTAATATSLTVTVPSGATYQPITVTDLSTGLTGYSAKPFVTIFTAVNTDFSATSFAGKLDFGTGYNPTSVSVSDINVDGKPDMVVANSYSSSVSVFKNTSTSGTVSFAKSDFAVGERPYVASTGDLDGDGKMDLAVVNYLDNTVSVLKNTSTGGTVSFAAKVDYATGTNPRYVSIGDIDGDGKLDVAVVNYSSTTVSVLRNTSTSGTISFAAKADFATGTSPSNVCFGDIDGDGKPDLVISNDAGGSVSVLRNTSTPGAVSFAGKVDIATGTRALGVSIGDLDGDGKADLAVANFTSNTISILRNTGTSGTISFASKLDLTSGTNPQGVFISDLNGNGKPDLMVTNYNGNSVSVFGNTSTSGTISFNAKIDYAVAEVPIGVFASDFDGDGRPDIAVANANNTSNSVSVLRNLIGSPSITSFTPSSAGAGATVTITGTNFTGATSVSFGGTPATSFNVVSSTSITAVVASGASGSISVTTPWGTATLVGFTFIPQLEISSTILDIAAAANSTQTFNITSNTNWNVSSSETWLTVSSSSGSGNAILTLTASANTSSASRSAVITVSASGVSSKTITVTQSGITGIADIDKSITVYPNPTDGLVYVNGLSEVRYIMVYGMNGSFVVRKPITNHIIDLSDLKNGTYIVRFFDDKKELYRYTISKK